MNKQYRKGYAFELKVKKHFEDIGFICFRTAGSHSVADVIAMGFGQYLLIQCKAGEGIIPKSEREKLIDVADKVKCIAVLATPDKGKIELKAYTNVFEFYGIMSKCQNTTKSINSSTNK